MTTFTSEDRQEAEKEPIPFAGWVQHSDDTVTKVIAKQPEDDHKEDKTS